MGVVTKVCIEEFLQREEGECLMDFSKILSCLVEKEKL